LSSKYGAIELYVIQDPIKGQAQQLTFIITATQDADIGSIVAQGQPREKASKLPSQQIS
jgi:hypothetical protein